MSDRNVFEETKVGDSRSDARNDEGDGQDGNAEGDKVTFPMRPGKKRILVRVSKDAKTYPASQSTKGASESPRSQEECAPLQTQSVMRKKVFVAKSVDMDKVVINTSNQALSPTGAKTPGTKTVYETPLGTCTASTITAQAATPHPAEATAMSANASYMHNGSTPGAPQGPRYDTQGKVVSYSILGSVEDFTRLSRTSSAHSSGAISRSPSRLSRRSSRRASARFDQMRMNRSQSILSPGSPGLEAPPAGISDSVITATPGAQSPLHPATPQEREAYLEQVRRLAAEETRVRAEACQAREALARKRKEAGMLTHERLLARRQERALAAHDEWQREWSRFKQAMCTLSGKDLDDLVISRADAYRERMEEYNYIGAAIPHHEKHGSEYWKMSLRGLGTRYVAVGNIFSGLFCPVNETSKNELQMIRIPRLHNHSGLSRRDADKPSWRDSPILQRRQRSLAGNLRKLRPHRLTDEDADALVLRGEPLLEWAYVSMEVEALNEAEQLAGASPGKLQSRGAEDDDAGETMGLIIPKHSSTSLAPSQTSQESANNLGPQCELLSASAMQNASAESAGTGKASKRGSLEGKAPNWAVSLMGTSGKVATHALQIHNTGSAALFFRWRAHEVQPGPPAQVEDIFFCSAPEGVVLPGEELEVVFGFRSPVAGAWKQVWTLVTTPSAQSAHGLAVELRAVCDDCDVSRTQRLLALDSLVAQGAQREEEIRDLMAEKRAQEAQSRAEAAPEYGLSRIELTELRRKRFENANRALGLYYHPALGEDLIDLARAIFAKLHAFDMVFDLARRDEEIAAKVDEALEKWQQFPSLVALRIALACISRGDPLRPHCRAPTVVDEDEPEKPSDPNAIEDDDAEATSTEGRDAQLESIGNGSAEMDNADDDREGDRPKDTGENTSVDDEIDAGSGGELSVEAGLQEEAAEGDSVAPRIDGGDENLAEEAFEAAQDAPRDDAGDDADSVGFESIDGEEYVAREHERLSGEAAALASELQALGESMLRPPLVDQMSWRHGQEALLQMADAIVDQVDAWREEHPDPDDFGPVASDEDEEPIDPLLTLHGRAAQALGTLVEDFVTAVDAAAAQVRSEALADGLASMDLGTCKLCKDVDPSGTAFAGMRVLVSADLGVRASEGDVSVPDEIDLECKLRTLCKTVEWLTQAGCASVLIADCGDPASTGERALLSSLADEVSSRLGREVTFVSDLSDEDVLGSLGVPLATSGEAESEDGDDDEEDDQDDSEDEDDASGSETASPRVDPVEQRGSAEDTKTATVRSRVEPDEVVVALLDARAKVCKTGDLNEFLSSYVEIIVHDGLQSMQTLLDGETLSADFPAQYGGFGLVDDMEASVAVVGASIVLVIGGEPRPYPRGQGHHDEGGESASIGDDDEGDDEEDDDDDDDEVDNEDNDKDEAAKISMQDEAADGVAEDETSSVGSSASSSSDSSASSGSSDGSVEEKIDPAKAGFMPELAVLDGVVRSESAVAVLVVGDLAGLFRRAIAELGSVASPRLLALAEGKQVELVIPDEEGLARSPESAHGQTVAARELELARTIVEEAWRRRLPLKVFADSEPREARRELSAFALRTEPGAAVLLLSAVPEEYATRLLLRRFGEAGNTIYAGAPQVWTQLEVLKSGAHEDDALEEEMDEEDRAAAADDEDSDDGGDSEAADASEGQGDADLDRKNSKSSPDGSEGAEAGAEDAEDDPYRLQEVRMLTNDFAVRELLSLRSINLPQGICAASAAAPAPVDETTVSNE